MSEKYSDVIIVGTDLAGLITGAFLAKRGLSVTVLNFEKDVASEKKNIQPNLITNLESRLFKSILGRLSILDHELNIIRRLDVPYQVVLPRHRIEVFRDREKFYREIRREFPTDQASIQAFYDTADQVDASLDTEQLQELILPHGLRNRWAFHRFVQHMGLNQRIAELTDSLGSNHEVRALLESQVKFLSRTHSDNPFTYQIAKTLSQENCLLYEVKGGLGHLKKLFLDKIQYFHGRVKNEVVLESFHFEKRKPHSVKLGGFEGVLGCKYLLWNEEIRKLQDFLPRTLRTYFIHKKIEKILPRYYYFSVQYQVDPEVIPVGMKENLLYVGDPQQELTGVNYLHLNLYHPPERLQNATTRLVVSYLLPAEQLHDPYESFQKLHHKITEILLELCPFSDGKIKLCFPLSSAQIHEGSTLFPMEKADFEIFRENAMANPVYQISPRKFSELFPLGNRTPYKNFYLTSPEILAALGSEGKFLLGLKTIDLIWNEVEGRRKKVIKQRKIP